MLRVNDVDLFEFAIDSLSVFFVTCDSRLYVQDTVRDSNWKQPWF